VVDRSNSENKKMSDNIHGLKFKKGDKIIFYGGGRELILEIEDYIDVDYGKTSIPYFYKMKKIYNFKKEDQIDERVKGKIQIIERNSKKLSEEEIQLLLLKDLK
jgi:hypothetical protein